MGWGLGIYFQHACRVSRINQVWDTLGLPMILTGFGLLTKERSSEDDDRIQEHVAFQKRFIDCQDFMYIVSLTTLAPSGLVLV